MNTFDRFVGDAPERYHSDALGPVTVPDYEPLTVYEGVIGHVDDGQDTPIIGFTARLPDDEIERRATEAWSRSRPPIDTYFARKEPNPKNVYPSFYAAVHRARNHVVEGTPDLLCRGAEEPYEPGEHRCFATAGALRVELHAAGIMLSTDRPSLPDVPSIGISLEEAHRRLGVERPDPLQRAFVSERQQRIRSLRAEITSGRNDGWTEEAMRRDLAAAEAAQPYEQPDEESIEESVRLWDRIRSICGMKVF